MSNQCSSNPNGPSLNYSSGGTDLYSPPAQRASDLSLSIQKKLLGRMAKKSVVKHLLDDNSARLLDNLQLLIKLYRADVESRKKLSNGKLFAISSCANRQSCVPPSAKDSDKVVKYLIKIIVKLGILVINNQFSEDDHRQAEQLQRTVRTTLMTVVSYHEVDFSYDQLYLSRLFDNCRQQLKQLIGRHLSDKSLARVDMIFDYFTNGDFLDRFFLIPLTHLNGTSNPTNSILLDLNSKRASHIGPSFLCPEMSTAFYKTKSDIIHDIDILLENKYF